MTSGLKNLKEPPFRSLQNPNGPWTVRSDYVQFRDGDGLSVKKSYVTQTEPLIQTPYQQWAWTSDHQGLFTELKIPCQKRKKTNLVAASGR